MICLGIDTTGSNCSAAVTDHAQILAFESIKIKAGMSDGHGECLAPMVQAALAKAGLRPQSIERIAVCTGPGSFTGVRTGLSFAKGFAAPRNIPVIGVSAFEVWAATYDPALSKTILAAADIKRGEVMLQTIKNGRAHGAAKTHKAGAVMSNAGHVVGSGAHLLLRERQRAFISPAILAWLAMDADVSPARPLYSRAPDAKLPGGKSLN